MKKLSKALLLLIVFSVVVTFASCRKGGNEDKPSLPSSSEAISDTVSDTSSASETTAPSESTEYDRKKTEGELITEDLGNVSHKENDVPADTDAPKESADKNTAQTQKNEPKTTDSKNTSAIGTNPDPAETDPADTTASSGPIELPVINI